MPAGSAGRHCDMLHIAINGHFGQSTGGSCGQQGMSSDIPAMAAAGAAPATPGAASGPVIRPAITKIASRWRRKLGVFTAETVSLGAYLKEANSARKVVHGIGTRRGLASKEKKRFMSCIVTPRLPSSTCPRRSKTTSPILALWSLI
jgi:hypothetical protein